MVANATWKEQVGFFLKTLQQKPCNASYINAIVTTVVELAKQDP